MSRNPNAVSLRLCGCFSEVMGLLLRGRPATSQKLCGYFSEVAGLRQNVQKLSVFEFWPSSEKLFGYF